MTFINIKSALKKKTVSKLGTKVGNPAKEVELHYIFNSKTLNFPSSLALSHLKAFLLSTISTNGVLSIDDFLLDHDLEPNLLTPLLDIVLKTHTNINHSHHISTQEILTFCKCDNRGKTPGEAGGSPIYIKDVDARGKV